MKIMVCCDDSSDNSALIEKARERAQASSAEIYLVCVSTNRASSVFTEQIFSLDVGSPVRSDVIPCEMPGGTAIGESLVEYAERNGIDEIVIGIQKRSKVGKLVFGSTAQYVILEAPCPVLAVKVGKEPAG